MIHGMMASLPETSLPEVLRTAQRGIFPPQVSFPLLFMLPSGLGGDLCLSGQALSLTVPMGGVTEALQNL